VITAMNFRILYKVESFAQLSDYQLLKKKSAPWMSFGSCVQLLCRVVTNCGLYYALVYSKRFIECDRRQTVERAQQALCCHNFRKLYQACRSRMEITKILFFSK
jgi:hypothetical protein